MLALNRSFLALGAAAEGDEVAFRRRSVAARATLQGDFTHQIVDPAGHFFALTRCPIDGTAIAATRCAERTALRQLRGRGAQQHPGAAHRFLNTKCYEPMAVK
jgi:hypothetical protein